MITGSTVLVMAGQGVISPVLPLFAHTLSVSVAAVGAALGIFGLARLIFNVPIGIVSDRYGRRLVLVGGPVVVAIGMLGSGLATTLPQLLVMRFVAGAGSAMYMTGAQLYLVDISTASNRARFIATNQGALLFGIAIGPGLGGLLAGAFGLRMPFYVVTGAAIVAAVYGFFRLPETNRPQHRVAGAHAPVRAALRFAASPDFVAVGLVTMAIFGTRLGARATLFPLQATTAFGLGPEALGGVFTATALIGLVLVGPTAVLADRIGRKAAIVPAGVVSGGGIVLMAVAPSAFWLVVGMLVTTVGTGIAGPAPAAYAGDIAPPELRGLGMGMYRTAGDVGFVAGPSLLGLLADRTSIGWAMVANAALMTFASLFFGAVARETTGARRHVVTEPVPEAPAPEAAAP